VSSTLFISDLHLDPARPAVTRALASFLGTHTHCQRLYILGDLFEAWLGDDDNAPLAAEVAGLLQGFTAAGPELYLMHGNRDFLLGERFCQAAGAQLLPDPRVIDLYGTPTLLMHGDSLCTADEPYQQFRRTARDPAWQRELLQRSLDERREFAARLRGMSLEANSNKAQDIMDVTAGEVDKVMARHRVRQLIHGHTHRPGRHQGPSGTRWVLGDWDRKAWVIEATNEELKLYNIDIIQ